jgi:hypothetical protein
MLLGVTPTAHDVSGSFTELVDLLNRRFDELVQRVSGNSNLLQYEFIKTRTMLAKLQQASSPSVFTLTPSARKLPGIRAFTLRLYCEEPGAWHPLPGDEGCYQIHSVDEWVRSIARHLSRVLTLLRYATPVIGSVLGVTGQLLHNQLTSDIGGMATVIGRMPNRLSAPVDVRTSIVAESSEWISPKVRAESDSEFRAIDSMLRRVDPSLRWGGLSRLVTPEGLTLYLCRDHLAQYQ